MTGNDAWRGLGRCLTDRDIRIKGGFTIHEVNSVQKHLFLVVIHELGQLRDRTAIGLRSARSTFHSAGVR